MSDKQFADIKIGLKDAVLVFSPENDNSYGLAVHAPKEIVEDENSTIPINVAVAAQIYTYISNEENMKKIIEYFEETMGNSEEKEWG